MDAVVYMFGSCTGHLNACLIEPRRTAAVAVFLDAATRQGHTSVTKAVIANNYTRRGGAKHHSAENVNTVARRLLGVLSQLTNSDNDM